MLSPRLVPGVCPRNSIGAAVSFFVRSYVSRSLLLRNPARLSVSGCQWQALETISRARGFSERESNKLALATGRGP